MCVCVCVCVFGREVCRGVESERIDSGDVGKRERERERRGPSSSRGMSWKIQGSVRACKGIMCVCVCVARCSRLCLLAHSYTMMTMIERSGRSGKCR